MKDDIGLLALITMFNLTNLEKCSIDISDKTRKQMESISVSTDRFSDPWTRWFKLPRFIFRRNFQLSFSVIWLKYYIRKELLTRNRTLESMVSHFCWMPQQYLSKNSMGWSQKYPSIVRETITIFSIQWIYTTCADISWNSKFQNQNCYAHTWNQSWI